MLTTVQRYARIKLGVTKDVVVLVPTPWAKSQGYKSECFLLQEGLLVWDQYCTESLDSLFYKIQI
jgi:hypothetical protein